MNEALIHKSFNQQGLMKTLGASLVEVRPGCVKIECPFGPHLTQQNDFFHAGAVTSVVDVACGYAARSMMPDDSDVLSVEFKVNLMRPASGTKIIAIGKVVKAGKTLTFCEGQVFDESESKLLATMSATMICIPNKK